MTPIIGIVGKPALTAGGGAVLARLCGRNLIAVNGPSWLLPVTAISAPGVKTSLERLLTPGFRVLALIADDPNSSSGKENVFAQLFMLQVS